MDLEKIKKLIEFTGSSRVSELTVTEDGTTVRIVREGQVSSSLAPPQHVPEQAPVATPIAESVSTSTASPAAPSGIISAPSFGLFHRAPSPGASPFVFEGDQILEGQELFIIEAMKVFNTVRATRGGKVARFLVNDGEDVELGQPVLELE